MSPDTLTLKIITAQGTILEKEGLSAVNLPLLDQLPIGIRTGHAPLIAETSKGKIKYRSPEEEGEINIHQGVLKVRNNLVTILTSGEVTEEVDDDCQFSNELLNYDRLMKTLVDKTFFSFTAEINNNADDKA